MSVTLRNVSPLGDLEINGVGIVEAGAEFTVTDEQGESLAAQAENFAVVSQDTAPVPDPTPVDATPATDDTAGA